MKLLMTEMRHTCKVIFWLRRSKPLGNVSPTIYTDVGAMICHNHVVYDSSLCCDKGWVVGTYQLFRIEYGISKVLNIKYRHCRLPNTHNLLHSLGCANVGSLSHGKLPTFTMSRATKLHHTRPFLLEVIFKVKILSSQVLYYYILPSPGRE